MQIKKLKVLSWNANGITNKINELTLIIDKYNIDIALIQETLLNKDTKAPKISNYISLMNPHHRGLITYIKRSLTFHQSKNTDISQITIIDNKIKIVNSYIPPRHKLKTEDLDEIINFPPYKMLMYGDLNSKHQFWNCHTNNANGNLINNYAET